MNLNVNTGKIRDLRILKGWSQEDLANTAGVVKKTVENAESGKGIRPRTLADIATALGVDTGELLVRESDQVLNSQPDSTPSPVVLGSVPPVPSLVLGREANLRHLKEQLTRSPLSTGGQRLTVVYGLPGVGKSTIAAAIAHDRDMANNFPDGILWVSLGNKPDLLAELAGCGRALGTDAIQRAKSAQEASQQLRGILYDKRMLLIIDDAWRIEDAIAFRVGGRNCATLVTTRLPSVAERLSPTPDDSYELDVLDEDAAFQLLGTLAPAVAERHPAECRELVRELECLPLAIEVAGRLLHSRFQRWEASGVSSVARLLEELKDGARILREQAPANMAGLLKETNPTVAALLQKSTDALDADTRERFAYLGAFASKPATFSLSIMAKTWKVDRQEARAIADRLIDHGLLGLVGDGRLSIHALLVSHARTLWK